uniref:DUF4201 domain-containing protein n=1 Tax=Glossina pallidipes TaxID=7398 RepID=A0A1A9ZXH2_GLOPL
MHRRATGPKRKLSAVYKFVRRDTESQSSDEDDDDGTDDEDLDYSTDVSVKEDDIETDEDIDLDTDTRSEEDLEPGELDYVRQKTLIPEEDFFKLLESFPSLSDFLEESENMEAEVEAEVIEEEEESIDYEGGVFVDPLTGEVRDKIVTGPKEYGKEAQEKSESKIESITEPATVPDIEPEIMSMPGSDDFWYKELDALYRSEEEAAEIGLKKEEEESNIEAMFADKVEEPVLITAHFDFDAWQKIEETNIIEESIVELLVDVIKIAIESSERDNAINQLYNNLNKNKIIKELFKVRNEQENENWLRTHLNRKCVEHYKRKKLYRTITEESTKVADYYNQKLYEQMIRLDNLLSEEKAVKAKTENLILQLRKELEDLKAINQNDLENFENMILHNIIRADCIHLRNSMRRPMDDMARERKNISLLHRKIIAKQQIILITKKKIADAEDLGDGLNISDYRSIQHDIVVLHGKIQGMFIKKKLKAILYNFLFYIIHRRTR